MSEFEVLKIFTTSFPTWKPMVLRSRIDEIAASDCDQIDEAFKDDPYYKRLHGMIICSVKFSKLYELPEEMGE